MGTDYLEELRGILVSGQEVSRSRALALGCSSDPK